jgi:hypothetical protein
MIDDYVERRLLDEAIRLGDHQADHIVALKNEVRHLRRAIFHAIGCLQGGRVDKARGILVVEASNSDRLKRALKASKGSPARKTRPVSLAKTTEERKS